MVFETGDIQRDLRFVFVVFFFGCGEEFKGVAFFEVFVSDESDGSADDAAVCAFFVFSLWGVIDVGEDPSIGEEFVVGFTEVDRVFRVADLADPHNMGVFARVSR